MRDFVGLHNRVLICGHLLAVSGSPTHFFPILHQVLSRPALPSENTDKAMLLFLNPFVQITFRSVYPPKAFILFHYNDVPFLSLLTFGIHFLPYVFSP